MKLNELRKLGITTTSDVEVTSVVADNRQATPGSLFAGVPGAHVHGARFADDAVSRGALGVLTDAEGAHLVTADVPVLVTDDVAGILGRVAALVYGAPAEHLTTFAITGTNGKTTTAFMIDHLLTAAGRSVGLIGTVSLRIGGVEHPAELTTPQPADLQGLLADHVAAGGTDLVMEVSSHALAQRRTDPVRYTVAGFTNLTQDHLDYHADFEDYFAAKASLFAPDKSERAVVWTDDEWGLRLYESLAENRRVWVGRTKREGRGWLLDGGRLHGPVTVPCGTALPGGFNEANAALATAMVLESPVDVPHEIFADITPVVSGRMEVVSESPRVVVDFAHNPDALIRAIEALDRTEGRLITLTGSAGERDRDKRPVMGRIVAELSDVAYITDDDPHGEDPAQIRAEILAGTTGQHAKVIEIGDRAEAIRAAIAEAGPKDTVLLAGRGHETFQDVAGTRVDIDDRVVAREALEKWRKP